jgi:hypothetical protein
MCRKHPAHWMAGYGELWAPIVGECSRKLHHFEVLDVDGPLPFSHVRN